jgi:hypothetical protein
MPRTRSARVNDQIIEIHSVEQNPFAVAREGKRAEKPSPKYKTCREIISPG